MGKEYYLLDAGRKGTYSPSSLERQHKLQGNLAENSSLNK